MLEGWVKGLLFHYFFVVYGVADVDVCFVGDVDYCWVEVEDVGWFALRVEMDV